MPLPGAVGTHRVSQIPALAVLCMMWSSPPPSPPSGATLVTDRPSAGRRRAVSRRRASTGCSTRNTRGSRRSRGACSAIPAAAEDVAQEVFLDLHRRFGDNPGRAGAGLGANRRGAHRAEPRSGPTGAARCAEKLYTAEPGAAEDPQAAVEAAETTRASPGGACPNSRGARRRCSALRYSGLSYAEMASALGIGVNGVGTRLRRAEARLRKEVGDASI